MKALSKLLACLLVCSMLFSLSCRDEIIPEKDSQKETPKAKLSNTEIKKEFGAALAKVLKDSPAVRKLIKDEALKQIDFDYDVLYLLVKDEILNDNTTLEEQLLKYVDPELLTSVEAQIPNLTIFVPKLPENSFSAELWDVENEAPCVGIRTKETNDIPAFDPNGDEYLIEAKLIPGYPILVVKENERIGLNDKLTKSIQKHVIYPNIKSHSNIPLSFIDECFDNINDKTHLRSSSTNKALYTEDQFAKVYEAYELYKNVDGWQRDYVYYDIKSDNLKGKFQKNVMEYLVGFEMTGNPLASYNKIADQVEDPHYDSNVTSKDRSGLTYVSGGWTDGEFEFKIRLYLGANSTVGAELVKYLRLSPNDVFALGTKPSHSTGGSSGYEGTHHYFILEGIEARKVDVLLPLFEWDLLKYSESIKITIEEYDNSETITSSQSSTSKFVTNFSYDVGFGEKVKIGMKSGISQETSHTTNYQIVTNVGSDQLGETIVNFSDDIIIGKDVEEYKPPRGQPKTIITPIFNSKYKTGYCQLYLATLKVY